MEITRIVSLWESCRHVLATLQPTIPTVNFAMAPQVTRAAIINTHVTRYMCATITGQTGEEMGTKRPVESSLHFPFFPSLPKAVNDP